MTMSIDEARAIVAGALTHAHAHDMQRLCVAVVDAGGHLVMLEREDSVPFGRVAVAHGKAHGAIAVGPNSRTLGELAIDRPHFMHGVVAALGGSVVPVAGGVVVVDGSGHRIGAVGISGDTSDNDEEAALAGIRAAGLSAQAG